MKKIIKGKMYDTDTAKCIGKYTNGTPPNHMTYYEETLYRKKTGEYFLFVKGNDCSKHAKMLDDFDYVASEDICYLSFDKARDWAEECLPPDTYMTEFEVIPDDVDEKVSITFYIPSSLGEKLKMEARKEGQGTSEYLSNILSERFEK